MPKPTAKDKQVAAKIDSALILLQNVLPAVRDQAPFAAGVQILTHLRMELTGELVGMPLSGRSKGCLAEIVEFCLNLDLPKADGEWFFFKCQGCGWKNNGQAIVDWQSTIRAWKMANIFPSQKQAQQSKPMPLPPGSRSSDPAQTVDTMARRILNR
jgi:hypothetical protein